MINIIYKIKLLSDWHCGSGLASGADVDELVIKEQNFPFIPGKTLKGLLKDAATTLKDVNAVDIEFIKRNFGLEASSTETTKETINSIQGNTNFSNAELTENLKKQLKNKTDFLYRKISSTAIEENGLVREHSLRCYEVVVPVTLFAKISNVDKSDIKYFEDCMKMIKRLGTGRNRGFGRCDISIVKGGDR